MSQYRVVDPATADVVEEFPTATDDHIRDALARSHIAFLGWRKAALDERVSVLTRVAEIYQERSEELASIIRTEMGKAVPEGRGEVALVGRIYKYFADNAKTFIQDEPLRGPENAEAFIERRPVGSLLGIMPWNFPYYQVARFAAPNLALGNTIILKHAPQCPKSAAVMEEIFQEAGLPRDAYINVYATNEQVSDIILPDPRNHGVSLTGSERAGSAVAAAAGENLKKVVLELGGSDPYILLDTDDLESTVETFFDARMRNTGQACNSAKRMIVMEDLYDEFVEKITRAARDIVPDDPTSDDSRLSPLSSVAARERFMDQLQAAIDDGATLRTGGDVYEGPGAFVKPAVLTDVKRGARGYYEELFGPAVMVFKASSVEEAVELANDTPFGLGSAVFSSDVRKASKVASEIEAGMVFVNTPEQSREFLPFGGVKRSGVGRELGPLAMDEFCNKRLVYKSQ